MKTIATKKIGKTHEQVRPKPIDEILDEIGHEIVINALPSKRDAESFKPARKRVLELAAEGEKIVGQIQNDGLRKRARLMLLRVRESFPDAYLILADQSREWSVIRDTIASDLADTADMLRVDRDDAEAMPTKKPLGKIPALVYEHLLTLPEHRAMTGPDILDWLSKTHQIFKTNDDLYKAILPPIEPYGLKNDRRIGYSIPLSARPKK